MPPGGACGALPRDEGGGFGFALRSPEGQPIFISSDIDRLDVGREDRSRPTKLTHVVLNATKTDAELAFFLDALGFRHSESTAHRDSPSRRSNSDATGAQRTSVEDRPQSPPARLTHQRH